MLKIRDNQFVYFVWRQINQIRKGGMPVLIRKLRLLFGNLYVILRTLSMVIPALPVVFLVRLVRPFILIRFGGLASMRIGHFAANPEVYLCEREAGMHGGRALDIFYHTPPTCNYQLKKMWDRTLPISWFARPLDLANRYLPDGKEHMIPLRAGGDRDIYGLLGRTPPHLSFTIEEEQFGQNELRKLGIPDGNPFVCYHARSSVYLNNVFPELNWRYHNYRDSNVHNYTLAAEELARRGYLAIRMGVYVKNRLNTINSRIIDYAANSRTDFLDIYLGAKCRFFLSSAVGLSAIPMVFRRPIAWANFIPLEYAPTWSSNYLFIPKKLWLRKESRFLTFSEILNSGIGRFLRTEQYERLGIEVVENRPEEITALVVEMDERLKGTWQTIEEDQELQRRFWALFKPSELNQVFLSRIGTEFLRQNRELLE